MMTVDFSKRKIHEQLEALSKAVGISIHQICQDQMRLGCNTAMQYTYPKKKAQGMRRVEADIRKVFISTDSEAFKQDWDIVGMGARAFKMQSGATYAVDSDFYLPSYSEADFDKHHERHRSPKTGRVTTARGGSEVGRNSLTIGRWKFVAHVHAKESAIRQHIRKKQKNVGLMRGGWLEAATFFAEKVNGVVRAPSWVRPHKGRFGYAQDSMTDEGFGELYAFNDTPYMKDEMKVNVERIAHEVMQKGLNRHGKHRIAQLEKQFSQRQAAS